MEKWLYGPMGPIKGGGGSPPWAWHQGWGPSPAMAGALPPWEFSPTWGRGGGWHPPLAYIRRGTPPFFQHNTIFLSLSFSFLEVDSPCLESSPGLEFSTIRQAIALLESGSESVFLPLLAWFGAREEHWLYRTCIISSRHYTCGATSSLEANRESPSPVVFNTTGRSYFWVYDNHARKNVSLFRSSKVWTPIPSITLHRHSIDLGFGYRRYEKFVFSAPYPNTLVVGLENGLMH